MLSAHSAPAAGTCGGGAGCYVLPGLLLGNAVGVVGLGPGELRGSVNGDLVHVDAAAGVALGGEDDDVLAGLQVDLGSGGAVVL